MKNSPYSKFPVMRTRSHKLVPSLSGTKTNLNLNTSLAAFYSKVSDISRKQIDTNILRVVDYALYRREIFPFMEYIIR